MDNEKSLLDNLGGMTQARSPHWMARKHKTILNMTNDDEDSHYIKKKQTMGLPWLLNWIGPPG